MFVRSVWCSCSLKPRQFPPMGDNKVTLTLSRRCRVPECNYSASWMWLCGTPNYSAVILNHQGQMMPHSELDLCALMSVLVRENCLHVQMNEPQRPNVDILLTSDLLWLKLMTEHSQDDIPQQKPFSGGQSIWLCLRQHCKPQFASCLLPGDSFSFFLTLTK